MHFYVAILQHFRDTKKVKEQVINFSYGCHMTVCKMTTWHIHMYLCENVQAQVLNSSWS